MTRAAALVVVCVVCLIGCRPSPFLSSPADALRSVASGFDVVYPGGRGFGLISPRLGIPALVGPRAAFEIEVVERGGIARDLRAALVAPDATEAQTARCLRGEASSRGEANARCVPLVPAAARRETLADGFALRTVAVSSAGAVAPAAWDLAVRAGDAVERQPRCVFTYAATPDRPRPLRVVHFTDLHLGKALTRDGLLPALRRVIAAINETAPDLVLLTGDIVESSDDALLDRSRALLLEIRAPLLVLPGNHDYSHFPEVRHAERPAAGWLRFARRFHARRRTQLTLGGWDFIGVDSGPSLFSPRVLTRGVGDDTVAWLRERLSEARGHGRGVIVYSHAPTRTGPLVNGGPRREGQIGRMSRGGEQVEEALQMIADQGTRALYLAGHTHWLEVHVLRPTHLASADRKRRWERRPDGEFLCRPLHVDRAAMVTTPAATRVTFQVLRKALHSGFAIIETGASSLVVRFRLFDRQGSPLACPR
jgi:hypothetical protein